jgi:putative SOS response-associated peptidase YedK
VARQHRVGPVYSGTVTDAKAAMAPLHNRMPVFPFENERDIWLVLPFDDLLSFQLRKFLDELIEMERTRECG